MENWRMKMENTYRWVPLKPDFWEHENQSGLLVTRLIYIKLYSKMENKFWKKNPG